MNPAGQAADIRYCSQCGQPKSEQELARFGNMLVCAECKPNYTQRLREGADTVQVAVRYAGFWIRLVALIIDSILLGFVSVILQALLVPGAFSLDPGNPPNMALMGLAYLLGLAISSTYEALFVNRLGATPGKLALGLKVIRPDGSGISIGRGYGRHFAKILSSIILCIGYIMAAFDGQKRALHDMVADTRVVRSRG